ncbi:MAG: NAD(P)-dependent oxidoreductase, partial [Methermicoccaceae archaeon]
VGAEVAKRCRCLEMKVIGYDPFITQELGNEIGIELTNLDELIKRSDMITVHTPLTKDTKNLLDSKEFENAKKGVLIINCARGGIINEEALAEAIRSGKAGGAAIDVFTTEPPTGSPLLELDDVIVTPHLGASTKEAQINVAIAIAGQIVDVLEGKPARNALNMPYISPEALSELSPYLGLAENLGKFAVQLLTKYDTVEISLTGDEPNKTSEAITRAAIKGVLEPVVGSGVNYVNAEYLAKERRLKVIKSIKSSGDVFENEITVKLLHSATGEGHSVVGSVVAGSPKIVGIDGYSVDVTPTGNMLVIRHIDKPNIIGPCCVVLGEQNVNIGGMQVGRLEMGGESIMVLSTDSEVSVETMGDIETIDGVLSVKAVKL